MAVDITFGKWLKRRRRALDKTQKELAQQVNCAVITIQKNPLLKLLVNVISPMPELVRNPAGAAGSLVQGLVGGSSASGGLADDLNKSPINAIAARGVIGSGRSTSDRHRCKARPSKLSPRAPSHSCRC